MPNNSMSLESKLHSNVSNISQTESIIKNSFISSNNTKSSQNKLKIRKNFINFMSNPVPKPETLLIKVLYQYWKNWLILSYPHKLKKILPHKMLADFNY
jgi:hypothetical protein